MSSLVGLLTAETNGAAQGTGIVPLNAKASALLGGTIPSYLITYVLDIQLGIFGSYPDSKDVAPSAVFLVVFLIFFLAHTFIFVKNMSRGHKFWLSIGFSFYCLLRWLGFTLRLVWAKDIMKLKAGMVSEVFLILPTIFLASFNLVLAQRIFTWRHPVVGSSKIFWTFMISVYVVVVAVVVMTIIASLVPYLYFLSEKHYDMCKNVQKVSSILVCLYSVLALFLTLVAFIFKQSGSLDTTVYQPWWIKSFNPFYYVEKNASQRAEQDILARDPQRALDAKRIIASTNHHLGSLDNQTTDRPNNVTHSFSNLLIAITSIFILIGAIFRAICTFMDKTYADQTSIFKPVVMYVVWGVLETVVNLFYLLGRVDLRFYRPDKLNPKNIPAGAGSQYQHQQISEPIDEKEHPSTEPSLDNQATV